MSRRAGWQVGFLSPPLRGPRRACACPSRRSRLLLLVPPFLSNRPTRGPLKGGGRGVVTRQRRRRPGIERGNGVSRASRQPATHAHRPARRDPTQPRAATLGSAGCQEFRLSVPRRRRRDADEKEEKRDVGSRARARTTRADAHTPPLSALVARFSLLPPPDISPVAGAFGSTSSFLCLGVSRKGREASREPISIPPHYAFILEVNDACTVAGCYGGLLLALEKTPAAAAV